MSVDNFVFLRDEQLPTVGQWQQGIHDVGINIVLDHVDDLRNHMGFLPAKFNGKDSGFEWFYGPADETFGETPVQVGYRSHAANFVTHSDMRELICALYALGVLANLTNGLYYDEDSVSFVSGDRAIELAREAEVRYL